MKRQLFTLCTALLMLPIGSVQAADHATPIPGESRYTGQSLPFGKRVRIALVTPGNVGVSWQSGTLVYSVADSVVLRKGNRSSGDDARVTVPLASMDRMQVRTGSKGRSLTGFIIGGCIGAIGGAASAAALSQANFGFSTDEASKPSPVGPAIGGAVVGGLLLGSFGALVGALIRTDQWKDVPLDQVQLGMISESEAGPTLGMTLRFKVDP